MFLYPIQSIFPVHLINPESKYCLACYVRLSPRTQFSQTNVISIENFSYHKLYFSTTSTPSGAQRKKPIFWIPSFLTSKVDLYIWIRRENCISFNSSRPFWWSWNRMQYVQSDNISRKIRAVKTRIYFGPWVTGRIIKENVAIINWEKERKTKKNIVNILLTF